MNEPNESQAQASESGDGEVEGLGDHAANNRRRVVEGHGGELLTERLDEFGSVETVVEETKLTEYQAEILWGLGHNKSAREVADEMDSTRESVRTIRHQALEEKFDRLIEEIPKIDNTLRLLEPLVTTWEERNPEDHAGRERGGDSEANANQ
jgi:DNA-directed RNA polymerase sigma subunit (sigma70/sigma32)